MQQGKAQLLFQRCHAAADAGDRKTHLLRRRTQLPRSIAFNKICQRSVSILYLLLLYLQFCKNCVTFSSIIRQNAGFVKSGRTENKKASPGYEGDGPRRRSLGSITLLYSAPACASCAQAELPSACPICIVLRGSRVDAAGKAPMQAVAAAQLKAQIPVPAVGAGCSGKVARVAALEPDLVVLQRRAALRQSA